MIQIEYVKNEDKEFWYKLDSHLPESEFEKKIRDKEGYVLFVDSKPVGILRYNLFWDNTPFCTLLFIDWNEQKKGYGKLLINHWEKDMKQQGYGIVLTSTQVGDLSGPDLPGRGEHDPCSTVPHEPEAHQ